MTRISKRVMDERSRNARLSPSKSADRSACGSGDRPSPIPAARCGSSGYVRPDRGAWRGDRSCAAHSVCVRKGDAWTAADDRSSHALTGSLRGTRGARAALDLDPRIEEAARDLGANRARVFRTITLPLLLAPLVGAGLLCAAISFDDVIVTNFVTGTQPTMPVWIGGDATDVHSGGERGRGADTDREHRADRGGRVDVPPLASNGLTDVVAGTHRG